MALLRGLVERREVMTSVQVQTGSWLDRRVGCRLRHCTALSFGCLVSTSPTPVAPTWQRLPNDWLEHLPAAGFSFLPALKSFLPADGYLMEVGSHVRQLMPARKHAATRTAIPFTSLTCCFTNPVPAPWSPTLHAAKLLHAAVH